MSEMHIHPWFVIGLVLVHPWQCRMCVPCLIFTLNPSYDLVHLNEPLGLILTIGPIEPVADWLRQFPPLLKIQLGFIWNKVTLKSTVESCFGIRFASGTHGYTPFADIPIGKVRTWASVPMDHNNFRYETNHFGGPIFKHLHLEHLCPSCPAIQAHRRRQREIGHPCEVVVGELRNQDRVPGGTTTKKTCSYGSYGSNHSYHLKD